MSTPGEGPASPADDGSTCPAGDGSAGPVRPPAGPRGKRGRKQGKEFDLERWKERGVLLRLFVYIGVTHLFAGFIWLLFYVGGHAHK